MEIRSTPEGGCIVRYTQSESYQRNPGQTSFVIRNELLSPRQKVLHRSRTRSFSSGSSTTSSENGSVAPIRSTSSPAPWWAFFACREAAPDDDSAAAALQESSSSSRMFFCADSDSDSDSDDDFDDESDLDDYLEGELAREDENASDVFLNVDDDSVDDSALSGRRRIISGDRSSPPCQTPRAAGKGFPAVATTLRADLPESHRSTPVGG
jgi:hypothetical protein